MEVVDVPGFYSVGPSLGFDEWQVRDAWCDAFALRALRRLRRDRPLDRRIAELLDRVADILRNVDDGPLFEATEFVHDGNLDDEWLLAAQTEADEQSAQILDLMRQVADLVVAAFAEAMAEILVLALEGRDERAIAADRPANDHGPPGHRVTTQPSVPNGPPRASISVFPEALAA